MACVGHGMRRAWLDPSPVLTGRNLAPRVAVANHGIDLLPQAVDVLLCRERLGLLQSLLARRNDRQDTTPSAPCTRDHSAYKDAPPVLLHPALPGGVGLEVRHHHVLRLHAGRSSHPSEKTAELRLLRMLLASASARECKGACAYLELFALGVVCRPRGWLHSVPHALQERFTVISAVCAGGPAQTAGP